MQKSRFSYGTAHCVLNSSLHVRMNVDAVCLCDELRMGGYEEVCLSYTFIQMSSIKYSIIFYFFSSDQN